MSPQERKIKRRISKKLEIEPDSEEAKDIKMAFKSSQPHHLNSRNTARTEPKKMMKKMRSIKLPKLFSLKPSARRATLSTPDWQSTDSSSNDSSSTHSSADHSINFSDGKGASEFEGTSDSSHSSLPNSAASGKKSTQTLTKSSSTRTVRKLQNRTSFKSKNPSVNKSSQISKDSTVNRATCSSTLKDSKFAKEVELYPGQSESEIIPMKKVCPYTHCFFHGHSNAPEPPPKHFFYRRRQSPKTQKNSKPKRLFTDVVAPSGDKKKALQTSKMVSNVEPASANANVSDKIPTSTSRVIKDEPFTLIQVSKPNDSGEATEDNGEISSTSSCHPLEEFGASRKEETDKPKPNRELISGSIRARDFETNGFIPVEDDKASVDVYEASTPRFKKNNHISMWHMIHQQMVSGLAEDSEAQQNKPKDEEGRVDYTNTLPETNGSGVSPDNFNSETGTENHVPVSQELELRKFFAIKMVREAIEKILLPEVEDQSSDMVSVTSEVICDEELSEKNQEKSREQSISTSKVYAEQENREIDNNEVGEDKSFDAEKVSQVVPGEENTRKKEEKQTLKGWSNLKKIILLKRFTKELEKVKKFNPAKPRHLPSEPDSEAEKVSLRRQMMGEKKNAEEWMLDYALQQAVSQLAPTQKRKVALLVKAFETVVPPQEDQHIHIIVPKVKDGNQECGTERELCESVSETGDTGKKIEDFASSSFDCGDYNSTVPMPTLEGSQLCSDTSLKSDEIVPVDTKDQKFQGKILNLSSDLLSEDHELSGKFTEMDNSSHVAGEPSCEVNRSAMEIKIEANSAENGFPAADFVPLGTQNPGKEETDRESGPEHVVLQEFPPLIASKPDSMANGAHKTQLDNQNIRMWHMIYQHVVSGIAAKVGTELLLDGRDEEQVEDGVNMLSEAKSSGSVHDNLKTDHEAAKENHDMNHQKIEFSRNIAVKLVQEAVDEILLPEIQDDSSDSQSIASDIIPGQEHMEKLHGDGGSTDPAEDSSKESDKNKVEGSSVGNTNNIHEGDKVASMFKTRLEQNKSKNWSKLKRLIMLKRSIKALESVRKHNPRPSQQLPLTRDPEDEKIDLRRQMMDERKKAEQWMLDYAVQHIVTTLTPARKRRVAMLVEAFEAVVPLPEV